MWPHRLRHPRRGRSPPWMVGQPAHPELDVTTPAGNQRQAQQTHKQCCPTRGRQLICRRFHPRPSPGLRSGTLTHKRLFNIGFHHLPSKGIRSLTCPNTGLPGVTRRRPSRGSRKMEPGLLLTASCLHAHVLYLREQTRSTAPRPTATADEDTHLLPVCQ